MLAIDVFGVTIAYRHDLLRVIVAFAGFVDLQFHAKVSTATAIEDWVGFVVIVLYAAGALKTTVAVIAIWLVVISVPIVGIVRVNDPAATGAGVIMVVVAGVTKWGF